MTALFVLKRELRALLWSPQTYAIGAAYLVISGIFFVNILISSEIPDLAQYYSNIANTLLVLVPIVAMRSFAEERRTGALDISLSWPGSRTGLVLGKFVANTLYLWLLSGIVWQYFRLVGDVADIKSGRTAGGYLGLLLMAAAFSALALMVSARASSPAAAAFLGFGLLLFGWILEFAPGWIGSWLEGLGPSKHFEPFPRGVLYWEDVAYFVFITLIGLGLAVAALDRHRPGRESRSRLGRAAALAGLLVVSSGSVALAGDVEGFVDLTKAKENSTTPTTRDAIARIGGQEVRLTSFAAPISAEARQAESLVKQYRAAGARIRLQVIDPDVQPGAARAAGISGYGETVVELGDRREVLTGANQGSLTSSLIRLSRPARPVACFTGGHGEREIDNKTEVGLTNLVEALRGLAFDARTVALAAPGAAEQLKRCAVVIVAGARVGFLPVELDVLASYIGNEGRLLVLADAAAPAPSQQLNEVLAPWGVHIGSGIVRDASALAGDPSSIVSLEYPSGGSPPVKRLLLEEIPVVFTNSVPIEPAREAEKRGAFSALVSSSPKSWVANEARGAGGVPLTMAAEAAKESTGVRAKGPFTLAALADWSRIDGQDPSDARVARTRIGVVGTAEMITNRVVDIFGNRQFATALIQWVAHEDDVIAAGPPVAGFDKVVLTTGQRDRFIRQGIVFPATAMFLPLLPAVWRLRRG